MRSALQGENEALRAEVALLRAENLRLVQHRDRVETELAHLVRLRAASLRLHEARHPEALLEALLEVFVNLVGSEMLGLYELEAGRAELVLRLSLGIDVERFGRLALGADPVSEAARTGTPWLAPLWEEHAPEPVQGPRGCVPLEFGGRVLGVILVFGLLPHKRRLAPGDRELLELLATEGARAMYCARGLAAGWPS